MRLRSSLAASAGAVVLLLATAGSASAANGQFRYTYMTSDGYEAVGFMNDPDSATCINIQGPGSEPGSAAYAPKNRTDAVATVFLEADCTGDAYFTLRPGGGASERLLVRSVVFS
ncbi:hypothetical protein P8A21_18720 [Streptomyces poriferorum]|uniref:Uncharacterized protein n=1 Tax=Streptomyces poriferorum TaxID=2798799 RepID=A0ABY9ISX2_9ACTN|nr:MULTISPECIES: hypothetical protein [Streptomyces]WSQ45327.1 hypothetical protein OG345_21210 [Streptomyces sp. NBC_01220]MBW5248710.1 hypothetical protein [Streptomyces poriferorum]MBW5257478.1 hypothetical protein [Streptomyces poriferorum]MDP5313082.1 hypothetical protein [Streptomyces sp. Alt4]WLQ49399.1 hypothetical protein P8A21_18720 [Streptomyces sp. Alt1]